MDARFVLNVGHVSQLVQQFKNPIFGMLVSTNVKLRYWG